MKRMFFDELDESQEQFRQRIFELIRATLVDCWARDHGGEPPSEPPNDEVIKLVIVRIAKSLGAPGDEEEVVEKVKTLYRLTANVASARKGLN
jgi:hypothetical protein